jgi:arginyl-tRNA synthetase
MVLGMSTREGNVLFLNDILDDAKAKMKEVMQKNEVKYKEIHDPEKVADIIGLSAIVIQDLSARRIKDYSYDLDAITNNNKNTNNSKKEEEEDKKSNAGRDVGSFEGDTGPYLQFAHARLCSMERKAKEQYGIEINSEAELSLLTQKEEQDLFTIIGKYPSSLQMALTTMEPCVVVTYILSLAHSISIAVEKSRVIGSEKPVAEARLFMYWCARVTLGNGLRILGLEPLERM